MNDESAEKQVLIVYYSLTGNTARVPRDLAVRLNGDVESIQDEGHGTGFLGQLTAAFHALRKTPARIGTIQRDPTRYAIAVVGTPVWSWQMTPAVRAYLQNTRGKIRNVAFFVTSGDTDVARIAPSLEALAGRKAVASAGFNARELADADTYQRKVSAFVDAITRATT
jgi:hypothetical protein